MKLPDFSRHVGLNQLRQKMGANLIPWDPERNWQPIDIDEMLGDTGIDIPPEEIDPFVDGTLGYRGRRVAVYIRDQYGSSDSEPHQLNKVHVADCSTLQSMRHQGRYERYVATTRTDGLFIVNFLGSFGSGIRREGVECELYVCINCLRRLNYNNYNIRTRSERGEIRESFNLEEFFERYGTQITDPPTHTDITAPLNVYSLRSEQISRRCRERVEWKCEHCLDDLEDGEMQRFLHLHHVNGLRHDNRNENLRALCIRCHAEEPQHQHLRTHPDYEEYMRILQNRRRRNV